MENQRSPTVSEQGASPNGKTNESPRNQLAAPSVRYPMAGARIGRGAIKLEINLPPVEHRRLASLIRAQLAGVL